MTCIKKYTVFLLALVLFLLAVASRTVPSGQGDVAWGADSAKETEAEKTPPYDARDISFEALAYAESVVEEDGCYTTPACVAAYLHLFLHLPPNFITKNESKALGYDSTQGNLAEAAPGKSIGGDVFGNYEGLLPEERSYRECDVNYTEGRRGAERLVYSDDGDIYYTGDHYQTFKKLY